MSHQSHFLEQTLRLKDIEIDRALTIYREPAARQWLVAAAPESGPKRVAVPLEPGSSPAWVMLDADGEVVTCLAPGMSVIDARRLGWSDVEAVLRQLPTLRGAEPDSYWTWRRLWHDLLMAGGWLSREAYEIFLREDLILKSLLPRLLSEGCVRLGEFLKECGGSFCRPPDRQPKEIRIVGEEMLWHLRHLLNLVGDLGMEKLAADVVPLAHFTYGHVDVTAAVALSRMGSTVFDRLEKEYAAQTAAATRAGTLRAIALVAARRPEFAAPAGRCLRRVQEEEMKHPERVEGIFVLNAALVSYWYLAAQGGRVGADAVSAFEGRSDPEWVRTLGCVFETECRELHERWPPAAWRPSESYLPRREAEEERRRGPRPCADPMWDLPQATLTRAGPKIGRNERCRCGSGRKAKRCCGTAVEVKERDFNGPPSVYEAEQRAVARALETLKAAATGR